MSTTAGPDRPLVIDAHQHVWDPAVNPMAWLTPDLAVIDRAFGPDDLAPLLAGAGVDATIVVQTRSSAKETDELVALAARTPFLAGIVGWLDLTSPAAADRLAAHRAQPGGCTVVGIRHQVHDEADPEWLRRADVGRGLAAVADAGLVYELLVRTRELPAAVAVARAHPDLTFVLDHAAKPPLADAAGPDGLAALDAWRAELAPLAECPNVAVKLSGLVTEAPWDDWRAAPIAAVGAEVLDRFGADRVLFGSDWPVCLLAADYGEVRELADELLAGCSPTERAAVLGGNARRLYALDRPATSAGPPDEEEPRP